MALVKIVGYVVLSHLCFSKQVEVKLQPGVLQSLKLFLVDLVRVSTQVLL